MPKRGLAFFADSPLAWEMLELFLKLKSAMPPPIDGTQPNGAIPPAQNGGKTKIANVGTGVVLPTLHDDDATTSNEHHVSGEAGI